jgi:hypothetical protein
MAVTPSLHHFHEAPPPPGGYQSASWDLTGIIRTKESDGITLQASNKSEECTSSTEGQCKGSKQAGKASSKDSSHPPSRTCSSCLDEPCWVAASHNGGWMFWGINAAQMWFEVPWFSLPCPLPLLLLLLLPALLPPGAQHIRLTSAPAASSSITTFKQFVYDNISSYKLPMS